MNACVHVFAFEINLLKTQLFSEMTSWHKEVSDVSELLLIIGKSKSEVTVPRLRGRTETRQSLKRCFTFDHS